MRKSMPFSLRLVLGMLSSLAIVLCLALWPAEAGAEDAKTVTVFAAASTTDALTDVATRYEKARGVKVRLNFAASSLLARQIEAGARADVFLSADVPWMDYLADRKLLEEGSRHDLLGNRLVLIAPKDSSLAVKMAKDFDFPAAFEGRLAVGDPALVPAGRYAKEALTHFGWYDKLQSRLLPCENVRAALAVAERGETAAAVVYATDAAASEKVRVVAVFPEQSHSKITYPVALCRGASAEGKALLAYLRSAEGLAAFRQRGFLVPEEKR